MKEKQRILVKLGTAVVTKGGLLSLPIIRGVARQLSTAINEGHQFFVISSGQVPAGKEEVISWGENPADFNAGELAAIGARPFLNMWERALVRHGLSISQGLLTYHDWKNKTHLNNLRSSGRKLSSSRYVPIGNENDFLSHLELPTVRKRENRKVTSFGDNDKIAQKVALALGFDGILMLTEAGGIFTGDPNKKGVRMYKYIDGRTRFRLGTQNYGKSEEGNGGPQSKINQAGICFRRGLRASIAGLGESDVIIRFARGESVGTTMGIETSFAA